MAQSKSHEISNQSSHGSALQLQAINQSSSARTHSRRCCSLGWADDHKAALPAQLLVKTKGIVVVMLRENLAVLETYETNALKAEGTLSGWSLGTPGAGIGAVELPFEGNTLTVGLLALLNGKQRR